MVYVSLRKKSTIKTGSREKSITKLREYRALKVAVENFYFSNCELDYGIELYSFRYLAFDI